METLLSVDLGTTAIKAAIYSLDGRLLGSSTAEYSLISPTPEQVEQDANLWWTLAVDTIHRTIAQIAKAPRSVRALSISSQGISFIPITTAGLPLGNALCWLDTRAVVEAAEIQAQIGEERLYRITGKRPSAAYVLPKLLWLRKHAPELWAATDKILLAHDWLIYRFCGAKATDYSLAGGTLLLDIHTPAWSEELLSTFEIPMDRLPTLTWAGTVIGELDSKIAMELGLPAGIPVVVGGQDQKCACLGASIRPGVAAISLGTACAISCLADRPILDAQCRIPCFPFVLPAFWVLEGVVGTAGATLRWARDTFFPQENFSTLDDWAKQSPPGSNGVCFYPHLAGAASPFWDAGARGIFTGLSLATGRNDIVRAILEGVAFQIRANLEVIEELAPVEELVIYGGGARSELWLRIISESVGKPLSVAPTVDVANWGACLLAGIGAGLVSNPLRPSAPTVRIVPSPVAVERYTELYQKYLRNEILTLGDSQCRKYP